MLACEARGRCFGTYSYNKLKLVSRWLKAMMLPGHTRVSECCTLLLYNTAVLLMQQPEDLAESPTKSVVIQLLDFNVKRKRDTVT